jgi:signal transduction histidine kinase
MKNLLIPFCLLCCIVAPAQKKGQRLIDSMLLVLPTLKEDSNKVNHIVLMSKQFYYVSKLTEGIDYLKEGLLLAEKINWKKGIANCYNGLGSLVGDTGNIVQARIYYEKSLKINREIDSKLNIITNLNNIGRGYQFESDFSNAVKYFFSALKEAEEIKSNETIALIGTNITATYIIQKNYSKAGEYAKMTLKNAEIAKTPFHAATALQHLGIIYSEKEDTAKAKEYFTKAMEIYRGEGVLEGEIECMSEISNLEKPEAGLKKKLEIQNILDKQNSLIPAAITNLGYIGTAYYDLAKTKTGIVKSEYMLNAESYLKKAINLAKETKYSGSIAELSMYLSEVEEDKENFKDALALNKAYHSINDSIYSQENKNKIAALESQKTVDLKDKEIQINKLAISNQRKTQLGLIGGLCLLGVIGGLLYWQTRTRKKTNTTLLKLNADLDEANKVKAKFFGILSHDLRGPIANLVNFLHLQKESPDLFTAEQAATNQKKISSSAESLLETMEAMLLWSKGQMQNFKPQIKMVPVSSLFEHLQHFFSNTENVSIQYSQPPGLMVSTDENYLQTIMHNLTSNAIRALKNTPNASIKWLAKQEGDQILLSVTDNGPGVKADQVKALNEDSAVVNSKTGFGFHIIRDLAKAIQCNISLQSGSDAGTTFVLSV